MGGGLGGAVSRNDSCIVQIVVSYLSFIDHDDYYFEFLLLFELLT